MPAHRKYFNLPESKTCPECGSEFMRPPGYGHDRWHKAELCSLACASKRGSRRKAEQRVVQSADIFERQVDKRPGQGPAGECWQWTGNLCSKGYGRLGFNYKMLKAHRIALFGLNGHDDPRMACHHCDNPACVRPEHLYAGTAADNVSDKMTRGRHRGNHRLTKAQVEAIIADPRVYREIAQQYGISTSNVGMIKQRLTWKDT